MLTTKDYFTVGISLLVLCAALYGFLERRAAARQASRIRVSTICDDLAKLDVEQADIELKGDPIQAAAGFRATRNRRRTVLASTAHELITTQRLKVSSGEYTTIGDAFKRSQSDWRRAEEYYQLAIAAAATAGGSTTESNLAHRTLARLLIEAGDTGAGNQEYELAIAAVPPGIDSDHLVRAETYALRSVLMRPLDPQEALRLAVAALSETELIRYPPLRAEAEGIVQRRLADGRTQEGLVIDLPTTEDSQ